MPIPKKELQILATGQYQRIVGIDEVGRGCWAGPVAVGAYIFHNQLPWFRGVADSKLVLAPEREKIYKKLNKHDYRVLYASSQEIDQSGISRVIEKLISQIVEEFDDGRTMFLIDGIFKKNFGEHSQKIIDGDFLYYSIAAASILAKVERDNLMRELDKQYPNYAFAKHKGYGTKLHQERISQFGISPIHRQSWYPIMQRSLFDEGPL